MVCAFIIAYIKEDNTIADTAWGLGFSVVAWASLMQNGNYQLAGLITTILVTIWSIRLIWHINLRNKGKSEDIRYKKMRESWGAWAPVHSFFKVFMLQGVLLLIVSYEVMVINASSNAPLTYWGIMGICLWFIGFLFEAVGDYQLYIFMKNPENKGKLLMDGLWRYTRHPNYFGEICMWWGIYGLAIASPYQLSAVMSPITITILLVFVSGVPMTEKLLAVHPDFANYKKRTSALIPWFPKK